jgi:TonB family protein
VVVAVQVDVSGCGKQRGIVTSSGSDDIDQAALEFVDFAEFFPGERNGTAVDGIFKTIVHFKLK